MATKAELEREIRDVELLRSVAEQEVLRLQDRANAATDESDKRRLRGEADRKEQQAREFSNKLAGLKSHLRGL